MLDDDRMRIPLLLSRSASLAGMDASTLRRRESQGRLVRLRRGVYVPETEGGHGAEDVRLAVIRAVLATRLVPCVLVNVSAAAWQGLPLAESAPRRVHLGYPEGRRARSRNGVTAHLLRPDTETELLDGVEVTTAPQTVADLASDASLLEAIIALDAALARGHAREEIQAVLDRRPRRGSVRASFALGFADGRAESPLESWSRLVIHALGFPEPVLQLEIPTRAGLRRADFAWPERGLIGEADGRGKYSIDGSDPLERIWREKERENELRETGLDVVRWDVRDLREPVRLGRRLAAAGLRSRLAPMQWGSIRL